MLPGTCQGPKDSSGFPRNPALLVAAGEEQVPTASGPASEEELLVAQGWLRGCARG